MSENNTNQTGQDANLPAHPSHVEPCDHWKNLRERPDDQNPSELVETQQQASPEVDQVQETRKHGGKGEELSPQ